MSAPRAPRYFAEKQISSVPTEYLRYFGIKYMLHSSNNPRKEEQHAYF